MTGPEKQAAYALQRCRFLPGSFDKRFVHQLDNWTNKEMTQKGRDCMLKLLDKHKSQIYNYMELRSALTSANIDVKK